MVQYIQLAQSCSREIKIKAEELNSQLMITQDSNWTGCTK